MITNNPSSLPKSSGMPLYKGVLSREGYGRDDGRDQGRDEIQRILYIKGFRAIDGRDGGFSDKNCR
jgi:hypothetical protein